MTSSQISESQLLRAIDDVEDAKAGPPGPAGVGISRVEQHAEDTCTFYFTDGSHKLINLPRGRDGETGGQGGAGERGVEGAPGRRGEPGSNGLPGRDGDDGLPGTSVDTAIVNSNGHLLIGMSDGGVVDVGRVVGPAGARGERGSTGLPGRNGDDGNTVLSGPRMPDPEEGKDGDHFIDWSDQFASVYKKEGGVWSKVASLRNPASGTQTAEGAGMGQPQDTRTLKLHNAGRQLGGKPYYAAPFEGRMEGIQPGYDWTSRPIMGLFPDPSTCKDQENFNIWVLQCLEILGSFHATYVTLDGTNASQPDDSGAGGEAPNQDEIPPDAGGADDNLMPDNIDGGSAFS